MIDCDEDKSVYSGHLEVELIIDRPPSEVWRQFLNSGSWITSHNIEMAYGTPGTLNSIMRVWAKEEGLPPAPYHYCKIIKLVPERQYLLKTYSEKGGSYGLDVVAFDDFRFVGVGATTRVVCNVLAEMKGEGVRKDPAAYDLEGSREPMLRNLQKLKQLVEGT